MDAPSDWYRDFFDATYVERVGVPIARERTAAEVDFLVGALELEPGARVLDVACGHGRHSLELARRGFDVVGADLSEPSIAVARQDAVREGLPVVFLGADMRELPFEREFDATLNLFSAFGYLETEGEDTRALAAIARSLRPGGGFLLEALNPLYLFRAFRPRDFHELEDGTLLLEERRYDAAEGRVHTTWTFARGRERTTRAFAVRTYTLPELRRMLVEAGLEYERAWGGYDGAEYGMDARRMLVLARLSAT